MIISNFKINFNAFINNSHNIECIINDIYFNAVESMNFCSIICDRCLNSSWHLHAYYTKQVNIYSRMIRVRITRIICTVCGKTHAILIEPMIPYISALFDDLVSIIMYSIILLDYSLCSYYRDRFLSCISTYSDCVIFNSRRNSIIFYPT